MSNVRSASVVSRMTICAMAMISVADAPIAARVPSLATIRAATATASIAATWSARVGGPERGGTSAAPGRVASGSLMPRASIFPAPAHALDRQRVHVAARLHALEQRLQGRQIDAGFVCRQLFSEGAKVGSELRPVLDRRIRIAAAPAFEGVAEPREFSAQHHLRPPS